MSIWTSLESTSQSIGTVMVASNSGLSLFDRPLDRQNRDVVCTYLNELPHKIVAVWICARPVNGMANGYSYEHWCVKIQAPPSLISIDFLESDGRGKFGLSVTTAMEAELQDFLMYYVQTQDKGRQRMKWRIVSSVTPSPLINNSYKPDYLDPHELSTLKKYMKSLKKKSKNKANNGQQSSLANHMANDDEIVLKKIKCNKKVCDIADFLEMWTEFEDKNKRKDKPYNAVSHNCQQFALHLFKYLIGSTYPQKVEDASKQTQSPFDIKEHKEQNKGKNDDNTTNNNNNNNNNNKPKKSNPDQDDEKTQ
eukprot:CAMPEP_0197048394 /NCGR_PEP_ID=MMETSP1384-20130603/23763_1 /TAXON_ID=29189 /ORGANISM="Ammonia sp." /LENGTH=307 /DNA_ID=CAMNT_0042480533 /DNA_START=23 /DNA_END=946 /DNA_ORIENTATION=-